MEPFLRINCGGPEVVSGGETWESDAGYLGTPSGVGASLTLEQTLVEDLAATYLLPTDDDPTDPAPQEVYASVRHSGSQTTEHRYSIPIADGSYDLRIHFSVPSELAMEGKSKFDLFIEGIHVWDDFDVAMAAGAVNRVYIGLFCGRTVDSTEGAGLQIRTVPVGGTDGAFELAIEVGTTAGRVESEVFTLQVVPKEVGQ
jgi:hypothetical protein